MNTTIRIRQNEKPILILQMFLRMHSSKEFAYRSVRCLIELGYLLKNEDESDAKSYCRNELPYSVSSFLWNYDLVSENEVSDFRVSVDIDSITNPALSRQLSNYDKQPHFNAYIKSCLIDAIEYINASQRKYRLFELAVSGIYVNSKNGLTSCGELSESSVIDSISNLSSMLEGSLGKIASALEKVGTIQVSHAQNLEDDEVDKDSLDSFDISSLDPSNFS